MKVNMKILSIPPYISTSWKNVLSLHIEHRSESSVLIIGLVNGSTIEIPNLNTTTTESVFAAHEKYLNQEASASPAPPPTRSLGEALTDGGGAAILSLPLGLDNSMGNLLQHNQEAANSPDLPKNVIEKIAHISKMIDLDNLAHLPKPEPHCNCMHCQIMRIIGEQEGSHSEPYEAIEEEEISDDDLKFREWNIEQVGDQLYRVSNPLGPQEQFSVFLGKPVGCTCGKPNCEHIHAVLNS